MNAATIRRPRNDVSRQPFIVIWEVTRACGLVCQHCRADAQTARNPFELSTREAMAMLDDLASLPTPRPLLVLTGGDPFERDDLAELVAYGTARGLGVALSPSVTPRLTPTVIEELRDAGAKAISLSLDGPDAATHDDFRGVDGVFDATLRAAETIKQAGVRLQINTTVTRRNAPQLARVLDIVVDHDASLWSVFFLVPTGRGRALDALDAQGTEDVLHWLGEVDKVVAIKATEAPQHRRVVQQRHDGIDDSDRGPLFSMLMHASHAVRGQPPRRRAARAPMDVNAGRGFVFVDHVGVAYPSGFLPLPVGSVRQTPLSSLYQDSPVLRMLRDPEALGGRCGVCPYREVCGGSRSRAFAVHGDVFGDDPSCPYDPVRGGDFGGATSSGNTNTPSSS